MDNVQNCDSYNNTRIDSRLLPYAYVVACSLITDLCLFVYEVNIHHSMNS
jgi:hypothetical protein